MSETTGEQELKPQDPELLPCQSELRDLCKDILALRPEGLQLPYWGIETSAEGAVVQEHLRNSSLIGLMLEDGDTLSFSPSNEHHPDLSLFVGQASTTGVSLRAWLWEYNKQRLDPRGPEEPPFDLIAYPGEKDWTHQLDICLHYKGELHTAVQTVSIQTGSRHAGKLPSVMRDISAAAYAEQGYEGHDQVHRSAADAEEASAFIALARELFEARVRSPEV